MFNDRHLEDLLLTRVGQEKEIKIDEIFKLFRENGSGERHARVLVQRMIEKGRLAYDRHSCLTPGPAEYQAHTI